MCLDAVTIGPTLGTYLKEDFLFPGEGGLYFRDSRAKKILAKFFHLKWVLNMVFMGEDWKMPPENISEQQKVENLISMN